MTLTCNDYGNPVYDKCNYCNDRGACEEEFQVRMTKDNAPIIDVTPFLHSQKYEKIKIFALGLLIGGSAVAVLQSALGLPMATLVMAVVFGAGYMLGADTLTDKKRKQPVRQQPRTRRPRNGGR